MRDVICNASPLQYLHQAGLIHLLPKLFESMQTPYRDGGRLGIDLPKLSELQWMGTPHYFWSGGCDPISTPIEEVRQREFARQHLMASGRWPAFDLLYLALLNPKKMGCTQRGPA